jgi:hypothetical protein
LTFTTTGNLPSLFQKYLYFDLKLRTGNSQTMNNSILIRNFFNLLRENTTLLASLDDQCMSLLREEYSSEFISVEVRDNPSLVGSNLDGELNICTTLSCLETGDNDRSGTGFHRGDCEKTTSSIACIIGESGPSAVTGSQAKGESQPSTSAAAYSKVSGGPTTSSIACEIGESGPSAVTGSQAKEESRPSTSAAAYGRSTNESSTTTNEITFNYVEDEVKQDFFHVKSCIIPLTI